VDVNDTTANTTATTTPASAPASIAGSPGMGAIPNQTLAKTARALTFQLGTDKVAKGAIHAGVQDKKKNGLAGLGAGPTPPLVRSNNRRKGGRKRPSAAAFNKSPSSIAPVAQACHNPTIDMGVLWFVQILMRSIYLFLIDQIQVSKSDFPYRSALIVPPIIFQVRCASLVG